MPVPAEDHQEATALSDEQLAAVFWEWWWNDPAEPKDSPHEAAIDDLKRLTAALSAAGYDIVKRPIGPDGASG